MPLTILITGFGPFPGAPYNPTGAVVHALAQQSQPGVRRLAHVFTTSYDTVDRELPALIVREQPAALIMFGLAQGIKHVRIETLARNTLASTIPDAAGRLPTAGAIVPGGPATLALPAPAPRILAAARATGSAAAPSRNAGSYLCNYLCWRASEAAATAGGPRLATFVHVPLVRPQPMPSPGAVPRTLGDLILAGEAIVQAAIAAVRVRR